jgi:CheY-like chemotaxis protein
LRNVVFRFVDSSTFAVALQEGDQELALPRGEHVVDGEWVLAIFEVGARRRATAAAGRGLQRRPNSAPLLAFERRDWERLVDFAEAGSLGMKAAAAHVPPPDPPTEPSMLRDSDPSSFTDMPDVPSSPLLADAQPPFSPRSASDPAAAGPAAHSNARVLVVDDDVDVREAIAAVLGSTGRVVESTPTAEEGLKRARAERFDLIVLDWNLPGTTGIELCRQIRRDPVLSTLPVLFLTAHASSRDVVEAFESGADDFVVKPFRGPELSARIVSLLRRARMARSSPDP